jgi:hypothetical protein
MSTLLQDLPPRAAHLPPMIRTGDGWAPQSPTTIEETGLDEWVLHDLALKLTATVPHLSTEWAAEQLRLPSTLIEKIFWQLKQDQLIEILGQTGEFGYRYAATDRGRERARQSMEVCGYVGPAPVSLNAYHAMLDWQSARRPKPKFEEVREAIRSIELPDATVEVRGAGGAVQPQPVPLRPTGQWEDEPRPGAAHRTNRRLVDSVLLLPGEQHHSDLRPAGAQACRSGGCF